MTLAANMNKLVPMTAVYAIWTPVINSKYVNMYIIYLYRYGIESLNIW